MPEAPAHVFQVEVGRFGYSHMLPVYRRQLDHCTRCAKPLGKGIAYMVQERVFVRFYTYQGRQKVGHQRSYAPVCRACTTAKERAECKFFGEITGIRTCPGCGRRMRVASFTVTHCSERCRTRAKRRRYRMKSRDCTMCHKPFETARRDAVYCSNACRQRHHRQVQAERRSAS